MAGCKLYSHFGVVPGDALRLRGALQAGRAGEQRTEAPGQGCPTPPTPWGGSGCSPAFGLYRLRLGGGNGETICDLSMACSYYRVGGTPALGGYREAGASTATLGTPGTEASLAPNQARSTHTMPRAPSNLLGTAKGLARESKEGYSSEAASISRAVQVEGKGGCGG